MAVPDGRLQYFDSTHSELLAVTLSEMVEPPARWSLQQVYSGIAASHHALHSVLPAVPAVAAPWL